MSERTEARERLAQARLALLFTPALCRGDDPLAVLEAALPHVDLVQVRIKHPTDPAWNTPARELAEWTARVLDLVGARERRDVLVFVNDRVDVAASLETAGVDGVHVGADDCPPEIARELLAASTLLGVSTHSTADVARLDDNPAVDSLGFGPIHPTATKGYSKGLGAEAAWIASTGTHLPLFPIGGIDATNVAELAPVGRAAVSSAVLGAADPGRAAESLRALLESPD